MKRNLAIATLVAISQPAAAGWFDVSNYEGKVGRNSVHLSIQTLNNPHPEGPADARFVIGSFYDPGERRPKAFHGKRLADGSLQLCETRHIGAFIIPQRDSWLQMKKEACLITLTPRDARLSGTWGAGKVPATFQQVGSMNNLKQDKATGKMAIPLWVADKQYMYVGTWGLQDGRLMLRTVDAIGIASGKRERTAALACMESGTVCPGLLYTEAYLAARPEGEPGALTVGYSDGERAEHDKVQLQPVW